MILRAPDDANFVALLPLSYIVPSFLLYFLTLSVLFLFKSGSNFNGSFYKIFGFSALNSMLCSIFYYFFTRVMAAPIYLPFLATLPSRHFLLTLYYVLLYNTQHSGSLFDLLLSFNRFTVIIFKVSYKQFWRKKLYYLIVLAFLLPNLLTWHLWFTDVGLQIYNQSSPGKGYIIDSFDSKRIEWMKNSRNTSIVIFTCSSLCLIMNLYVCGYLFYQKYQNMTGKSSDKTSPHNIKLFCFNILVFGGQLAAGILQVLFVVTPTPQNLEFFKIQVYVNDFTNLTPPWFLIALSTTLRREIVRQMCCVDTESNKVTVINSSTANTAGNKNSNRIQPSPSKSL